MAHSNDWASRNHPVNNIIVVSLEATASRAGKSDRDPRAFQPRYDSKSHSGTSLATCDSLSLNNLLTSLLPTAKWRANAQKRPLPQHSTATTRPIALRTVLSHRIHRASTNTTADNESSYRHFLCNQLPKTSYQLSPPQKQPPLLHPFTYSYSPLTLYTWPNSTNYT